MALVGIYWDKDEAQGGQTRTRKRAKKKKKKKKLRVDSAQISTAKVLFLRGR